MCHTQLEVNEFKNGSVTSTSPEKEVVNRKNNHKEVPRETHPNSIPQYLKAVVDGPAGPAMAVPLFFARNGFSLTTFLAKYVYAGPFSYVSSRPSLMIYFSMIKD